MQIDLFMIEALVGFVLLSHWKSFTVFWFLCLLFIGRTPYFVSLLSLASSKFINIER